MTGSLISAKIFNSSRYFCIRTRRPFFTYSPPHSSAGVTWTLAILRRSSSICVSLVWRSARSRFRASWKHWYGSCSKGILAVDCRAARRLLDPMGCCWVSLNSLLSSRGVATLFGSKSRPGGGVSGFEEGLSVDAWILVIALDQNARLLNAYEGSLPVEQRRYLRKGLAS